MKAIKVLAVLFCVALTLHGVPALAQVQAGRIVGTVYDPADAVVPGALVTVTNTNTNVAHSVTTNPSGDFVVTTLNPGVYDVSATLQGFQTVIDRGVELLVGQTVRLDLRLAIGETTTVLEVTADVPLLSTDSGTVGQVISNKQITDLPLNGRGFHELARLTPGAATVSATGNVLRIRPEVVNSNTISGVRGSQITFLLDGADVTEQHQGGTYIQASIDALQEFSVQQNAYSAEYSRAGGFFNATTKSGANDFHGALFEFLRNDKLDARGFFARDREILKRNQYGGALGGRIFRDKTFFFVNYEAMRERVGLLFNNIVPSLEQRNGNFSRAGLNRIYDPLSQTPNPAGGGAIRTQFTNNTISQDRLSSQAKFFNEYIAQPNTGVDRSVFSPSRSVDTDQITARIDHQFGNTTLFGRLSWHDNRMQEPNSQPTLGIVPLNTDAQNIAIGLNSSIRPTVINEFRFNVLPSLIDLAPYLDNRNFNKEAGIAGFEDTLRRDGNASFPDFLWTGYASLRGSSFDQRPKTQDRLAYEFTDNMTWIKGSHIFKFGTKIRYYEWLGTDGRRYAGEWNSTGINTENPASVAGTGDGFADWMLGFPASSVRGFPGDTFGGYATYWHFFVQDDIKVTNRLTLNLGLRYEYTPWARGYRGQLGTFDPTQSRPIIIGSETDQIDLDAQLAAPTAYEFYKDLIQTSSQAGLPLSITAADKNQWAPRLGFAWRPLGDRTVIRGGYGIFYESEQTDGRVNLNMIPFNLEETALATRGAIPTRTIANFFQGSPIGSFSTAASINPSLQKARMGYDQHWNFGVQQQLTSTLVFDVSYVGNHGVFLAGRQQANLPVAGSGAIAPRRPFTRFGNINYYDSNANNTYHSLQGKLEQRLASGLWFLMSYTYSKSIEYGNNPGVGGTYAFERGLSAIHVPHNFATSFGYELPFGRGKRFGANSGGAVNGLLGGWQLQGIMGLRAGLGFTPAVSRDVANIGVGGQRPTRIGSGKVDEPTLDRWFDSTAFVVPANFTYGNSGLRILRGDIARVFDFSILKNFNPTEGTRLQFRAEFFNLPNTPSFDLPAANIDSTQVGRVTATSSLPRQIQFGLKFNF
jgi:hypothetical protein